MNKCFVLIIVSCFIFSCRTLKNSISENPKNNDKAIQPINWFSASGSFELVTKEEKINLKTNIKIIKDSLIWCSASLPFGIEVYRAQITKDSIYIIDKINHKKIIKSIDYLSEPIGLDVSFLDLCAILIGKRINQKKLSLQIFNSEFLEYMGILFPHRIEIKSQTNISLTLLYNNIIINKPQKTPFILPENYVKTK